jgi:hypothetical protein
MKDGERDCLPPVQPKQAEAWDCALPQRLGEEMGALDSGLDVVEVELAEVRQVGQAMDNDGVQALIAEVVVAQVQMLWAT